MTEWYLSEPLSFNGVYFSACHRWPLEHWQLVHCVGGNLKNKLIRILLSQNYEQNEPFAILFEVYFVDNICIGDSAVH